MKNASGLPYWRLSLFYFFYFAVLGGFMPYWSLYLDSLHFLAAQIGQLMAIGMLTRIVAPNFWGYLADRTGQRMQLVRLGAVMVCVLWACIFWVGDRFGWMALVLFGYSFFQNAILAQFEAVTIAHLGTQRARYGRIRLWGSLGFIATVAGFGLLFDRVPIHYLPLLLLATAALAALLAFAVPAPAVTPVDRQVQPFWHSLRRVPVLVFFVVHFLLQFSHAPYYSFYSLYLEEHSYSRTTIGLLWSLGVLAEVLAFTQTHRLLARFSERGLLLTCLLLSAVRWLVIANCIQMPWLIVSVQVLHAFSFAVFHAVAMQLIFREFSAGQQGQGQAVYSALWGLGVALGSWLAGAAWQPWGAMVVYGAAATSCVLAVVLLMLVRPPAQTTGI